MRHNIETDEKLTRDIDEFIDDKNYTKKQLFTEALKLFLTVKKEEDIMSRKFPGERFRTKLILEPVEEEMPEKMASVLIY